MSELSAKQKESMMNDRLAYLLVRVQEKYLLDKEAAYGFLMNSLTLQSLTDFSCNLYYAHKEALFDLLCSEYEGGDKEWFKTLSNMQ